MCNRMLKTTEHEGETASYTTDRWGHWILCCREDGEDDEREGPRDGRPIHAGDEVILGRGRSLFTISTRGARASPVNRRDTVDWTARDRPPLTDLVAIQLRITISPPVALVTPVSKTPERVGPWLSSGGEYHYGSDTEEQRDALHGHNACEVISTAFAEGRRKATHAVGPYQVSERGRSHYDREGPIVHDRVNVDG
ncbi:hypothetical protein OH77DRAFT_113079 [Trametes cingulata]|nr:hypothetical protein OH77DRAFT_113079 [Trametes cingulata]